MKDPDIPRLHLHDHFDLEEQVWRAKGYLFGVRVECGETNYLVDFYDPVRLAQDLQSQQPPYLLGVNVVVVSQVTRASIQEVMTQMATTGQLATLRAQIE